MNKAEALAKRLKSINSNAKISFHSVFLSADNIKSCIEGKKVAINALDFTSEIPSLFDEVCRRSNIPIIHPFNIGWGGIITVVTPKSQMLNSLSKSDEEFNEVSVVKYASDYLKFWGEPQLWIDKVLEKYENETLNLSPPQLSIGSWIIASMCTHVLYKLATKKEIKTFPEFYLSTIMEDNIS